MAEIFAIVVFSVPVSGLALLGEPRGCRLAHLERGNLLYAFVDWFRFGKTICTGQQKGFDLHWPIHLSHKKPPTCQLSRAQNRFLLAYSFRNGNLLRWVPGCKGRAYESFCFGLPGGQAGLNKSCLQRQPNAGVIICLETLFWPLCFNYLVVWLLGLVDELHRIALTPAQVHKLTHAHVKLDVHIYTHLQTHTYHICLLACLPACMHACIHAYLPTYLPTYMQTHTYTYIHIHTYTPINAHAHTHTHACMHTHAQTHTHTDIHTDI